MKYIPRHRRHTRLDDAKALFSVAAGLAFAILALFAIPTPSEAVLKPDPKPIVKPVEPTGITYHQPCGTVRRVWTR